jgi:DNA-binding MarR family transcriptional regulator
MQDGGDFVDDVVADWERQCPELDTRGIAVLGRLMALSKHLEVRLERVLEPFGVPLWGFDVLFALRRQEPPHQLVPTQLMRCCFLSSGAMTHRLDRLEGQGLIERQQDREDRRSFKIRLTAKGKELVDQAMPARIGQGLELLEEMTPRDQATLTRLLRKLLKRTELLEKF